MERFPAYFGDLVDPRIGNAQRHDLLEILLIALSATLCGAETCVDMAPVRARQETAFVPVSAAVDGKTACRSFDRKGGRRPLNMVSAWGVEQRLVLGQRKIDGASNEIEALLALLAVEGRIVTADAMHGQKATARTILERGGDHSLALKGDQRPGKHET